MQSILIPPRSLFPGRSRNEHYRLSGVEDPALFAGQRGLGRIGKYDSISKDIHFFKLRISIDFFEAFIKKHCRIRIAVIPDIGIVPTVVSLLIAVFGHSPDPQHLAGS